MFEIRKGFVIDVEGNDGSGKRTTAELLRDLLISAGFDAEIISFPQHGEVSGQLVDEFLYNGLKFSKDTMTDAVREGALYAIDRMVTLSGINANGKSHIDDMKEGKILIMDRYVASNFIHRSRTMTSDELDTYMNIMEGLEYGLYRIPEPDYTFVLKVDPEVSRENILKRNRETDENETLENLKISFDKLNVLIEKKGYIGIECCETIGGKRVMRDRVAIVEDVMQGIIDGQKSLTIEVK